MLNTIRLLSGLGKTVSIPLLTSSHIVASNVLCHLLTHLSGDHSSMNKQNCFISPSHKHTNELGKNTSVAHKFNLL